MKYLLGGTALAAVLAIAAPLWAQSPTSSGAPSSAQPAAEAQQPSQYGQQPKRYSRAHHRNYVRRIHHRGSYGWAGRGPTDNVANQLNRAQLGGMAYGSSTGPAGNRPGPAYPPPGPPPQYQQQGFPPQGYTNPPYGR
jgi:hypothetical protein